MMNREQLEALALELKDTARARMGRDDLFVCVVGSPQATGMVVGSSLEPGDLKRLFVLLGESAAPERLDFGGVV